MTSFFFSPAAIVEKLARSLLAHPRPAGDAGYADLDLAAQLYPALTTVRVPRYEMGRQSVRQLLRRLSGDTKSPTIVSLGFQIIDRESA
jgi:LacI family gluconate utilization system Gnt-I transcriptional repressor